MDARDAREYTWMPSDNNTFQWRLKNESQSVQKFITMKIIFYSKY